MTNILAAALALTNAGVSIVPTLPGGENLSINDQRRFWQKVNISTPEGCWEWIRSLDNGYGRFWHHGRTRLAHRVSYQLAYGAISPDLHIDHLCRNRSCVNPAHLEPVSIAENVLRGEGLSAVNARKTHCHRGHPLSGGNLYITPKRKARSCRQCNNLRSAAYAERQKRKAA